MSAPPKPWERAGVNNQNANIAMTGEMSSSTLPDTLLPDTSRGTTTPASRSPPLLPNRPTPQMSMMGHGGAGGYGGSLNSGYGGYNNYGGGYSPMYGGGGMYGGGYGSYGGYGMNRFGNNTEGSYGTNSFARQAEESSRQAFQSIESIVQAVGSISMMLESSFYAVYNSFRAVVGVADHFSRMKMAFAQIFSALAVIRTLRWLYNKLLVLLRLRPQGSADEVWAQVAEEGAASLAESKDGGRSSWPIMLFFAIIIGGPWLIWRVLASITGKKECPEWQNGNDDHFHAVAEFDFEGEGDDELSFRRGQHITIAPKELQPKIRGWLLASVDGKKQGIVPANYVKVLGKRRGRRHHPKQGNSSSANPLSQTGNLTLPTPSISDTSTSQTHSMPVIQQGSHIAPPGGQLALEDSFTNAQIPSIASNSLPTNQTISNRQEFQTNTNSFVEPIELGAVPNTSAFEDSNVAIGNTTKTAVDILSKKEEIN